MRLSPRGLAGVGGLLVLGAGLLWIPESDWQPLPKVPGSKVDQVDRARPPTLDPRGWEAPWMLPPAPKPDARVVPVPEPEPEVVPAPPPPVVPPDRTSVRYLGTLVDSEDQTVYLFKHLFSNQILRLMPQVEVGGWTLVGVEPRQFLINGPGGTYAVSW